VIPIALSYKIIKNSSNTGHKHLSSLDAASFTEKEKPREELLNKDESDEIQKQIELEAEIRRKIEEETASQREALLEMAMSEADSIRENARREGSAAGYEEGYQRGFEDGRIETEGMRKSALRLIEDAEQKVKEYFHKNEEKLLSLAAKIAGKIVHQTIDSGAENIMILAKPVLQQYGKSEKVVISCHPDNVDFVRGHLSEVEKLCPSAHILILEDGMLERNGMVIENESQITDLQIKKQLDRFMELAGN
jgi:flagellar assembly protein FliH